MNAILKSLFVSSKSLYKKLRKRWRVSKTNEYYILDNLSIGRELEDFIFILIVLVLTFGFLIKSVFCF